MTKVSVNPLDTEWYRCSKCNKSFFIKTEDPDRHLIKKSMRCPNFIRCNGRVTRKSWNNVSEIRNFRWVTAKELYQASAGIGFTSERDCSPDSLKRLLHGIRIIGSELQTTGDPKKSILMSLTLETGKVIHLSSSVKGAIIYKVTEVGDG